MFQKSLFVFIAVVLMSSCRQAPKEETNTESFPSDSIATEAASAVEGYSGETAASWSSCFASRTSTPREFGDTYNYEFVQLNIAEDGRVSGTMINAPYGTDGSRGSLTGVYRKDGGLVQTTITYLAEGEIYEEQRDFIIAEDGLSTLNADREPEFTIPEVSCEQFGVYMREFTLGHLRNQINTSDRSRLKQVDEVKKMGYSGEQLDQLRFMEVAVDLDNDYQTEEYLLYIMDSMLCGSGGCNLLVIDGNGNTLSNTTVVKLPIYMPTQTIADMASKGLWKPLYVWSQGFRELEAGDGGYPDNASMAPEIPEEALTGHPEKYKLILDYLD